MGITESSLDVGALRRCISDVVALSTLSAVWAGATRPRIAESLAQVLQETLGAEVVYVGLRGTDHAAATEGTCLGSAAAEGLRDAIRSQVVPWLGQPADGQMPLQISAGPTAAAFATPIGIYAEHGVVVTVVSRDDFPSETDGLVLNIAANQATVALLTDRAREEQRIADTLQRIGIAVAAELDPEKVIQAVTDEATALTGANFGAFFYNVVNAAGESTCCTRWRARHERRSRGSPCRATPRSSDRRSRDPAWSG